MYEVQMLGRCKVDANFMQSRCHSDVILMYFRYCNYILVGSKYNSKDRSTDQKLVHQKEIKSWIKFWCNT